jgi:hypothetical protein
VDFLKGFDLTLWWNSLIAIGLAIIVAALAAHERGLIFIGLGMISWGFGEWVNHKQLIQITPPNVYVPQSMITSYPRFSAPFGLCLDGVGLVLIVVGLWKLLFS